MIPFEDDVVSKVFSGRISFSRDQNEKVYQDQQTVNGRTQKMNNDDSILQMTVRASATPSIIKKLGPFVTLSKETLSILNYDYLPEPQLLALLPPLFTGAIIQNDNIALIILSVEVYSRHNNIDFHSETNESSINEAELSCSIRPQSHGGVMVHKLIIETTSLNLLVVASIEIASEPKVRVGPHMDMDPSRVTQANVFVREIHQQQLIRLFNEKGSIPSNLNNLRQLTTSLFKLSTYKPWRSSLKDFDTRLTIPATIFTLCSLPSNGYGFGPSSLALISSHLLQLFALAVINNNSILMEDRIEDFFVEYSPVLEKKKNCKDWEPLCQIGTQLKEEITSQGKVNVIKFCLNNNVSTIAQGLSSIISTANEKISQNIKDKFLSIYK